MAKRYRRSAKHNMVWRMRDDVFVSRHFGLALVYLIPSLLWTLVTLLWTLIVLVVNLLKLFWSLIRLAFFGIQNMIRRSPRSK